MNFFSISNMLVLTLSACDLWTMVAITSIFWLFRKASSFIKPESLYLQIRQTKASSKYEVILS